MKSITLKVGSSNTCLTAVNGPALTIGFVVLEVVSCGCADTLVVSRLINPIANVSEIPIVVNINSACCTGQFYIETYRYDIKIFASILKI